MDFFQTVKQIGIFIICAQVIMHFKPSAKYEKYLKLLISVMVLVQVLMPLVNIVSGKNEDFLWTKIEQIQAEIDKNMEQLEIENAINEENIINQTLDEIKLKINYKLKEKGVQVKSVEYSEENGKEKIILYLSANGYYVSENIKIDTINIGEQEVMGRAVASASGEEENNQEYSEKLHALYNVVSSELGMTEEQIEVVWNG